MNEVEAIIEDPRGSTVRHHWNEEAERWETGPHRFTHNPWPANYGYIPDTLNEADGEDLDILVLASESLATGSRVAVRPVGLLLRPDGDDKVLGVLVDDPSFGDIERFLDVPEHEIQAIEIWFGTWSEIGEWRDEIIAVERIEHAAISSP